MPQKPHLDGLAMGLMVLLCALWGFQQVTIKVAASEVPFMWQAAIRSAIAAVLTVAWCRFRGVALFRRDGTLGAGILAGTLFGLEFLFIYWGLGYTHASRAVIFIYLAPFVVALGAHFLFPGERLSRIQVGGLVCAFVGLGAAFSDALRLPTDREVIGDMMMVAAAVLWGATTIVIKMTGLIRIRAEKTLFYQLAVSAPLLLLFSPLLGEGLPLAPSAMTMASLVYQAVLVAFASYMTWFWLITVYPAARLSAFTFLTPLFGVASGHLFLDEPLTAGVLLGAPLVGAGLYLVNRRAKPAPTG